MHDLFGLLGIGLGVPGLLLLFRYGMPHRVENGGHVAVSRHKGDVDAIRREAIYQRGGELALILILLGAGFQTLTIIVK